MNDTQKLTSLAASALIAGSIATSACAQGGNNATAPTDLQPIPRIDVDILRSKMAPGGIGLKPKYSVVNDGFDLPFGMNYNRDSSSLLMPIDPKNEWGIGLNLNLNSPRALDMAPSSGLGLQPKRTPGVTLQKRF